MFKLNRKNGVSYYTITSFEETGLVKHGFSTREGGVSDGCYSSMNFRFHCDDTRENVLKNFEIMADTLGMDYNKLVLSKQVHEDVIHTVTEDDLRALTRLLRIRKVFLWLRCLPTAYRCFFLTKSSE